MCTEYMDCLCPRLIKEGQVIAGNINVANMRLSMDQLAKLPCFMSIGMSNDIFCAVQVFNSIFFIDQGPLMGNRMILQ